MSRLRGSTDPAEAIIAVVRLGVLSLCFLLSVLADQKDQVPPADLVLLLILAAAMSIPVPNGIVRAGRPFFEALAASAIIGLTASTNLAATVPGESMLPDPLLPYLVVPPLAAGLLSGAGASVGASTISLVVLVVTRGRLGDLAASRTAIADLQFCNSHFVEHGRIPRIGAKGLLVIGNRKHVVVVNALQVAPHFSRFSNLKSIGLRQIKG
jgi:hypothetical protein